MIASEIAKDALLPFVISRIGAQTIGSGIASRNSNRIGQVDRNATSQLRPRDGDDYQSSRRLDDHVFEQRERNMRIREEAQRASQSSQIASNPLDQPTIAQQYGQYGNSPFAQRPVIQPIDTLPQQILPAPLPIINNDRSAFEDEDEDLDTDLMHQRLIDNINNGIDAGEDLPLDNDSYDSVEEQRRQPDIPPEYPNGGNGNNPSIGDIVRKGDEIVKVIQTVIPKKKPEEQKEKPEKKPKPPKVQPTAETTAEKKSNMKNAKVDIHEIYERTLVNKPSVNTKRLL